MPISYRIDYERKVVLVRCHQTLTDQEVFGYQKEVWSRAEVAGFDELIDMTAVDAIALPSAERVKDLAALSAGMDHPGLLSRLAIVAPGPLAYGLGRMYEAFRGLDTRSTKEVCVFQSLEKALQWLGLANLISQDGEACSPF